MSFRNFTSSNFGVTYESDFNKHVDPTLNLLAQKIQEHFPEQKQKELNFDNNSGVLPMRSVEDAIKELEELEKNQKSTLEQPKINIKDFGLPIF